MSVNNEPTISLITGVMFSEKTAELIRRLTKYKIGRRQVIAFYPTKSERSKAGYLTSRTGAEFPATPIDSPSQILSLAKEHKVVGIDEAHFFDEKQAAEFAAVCFTLFLQEKKVYIVALDTDYTGRPFGITMHLMAIPEVKILRLTAVCIDCCNNEATRSHRLTTEAERLAVGDKEYIALCYRCFEKRNPGLIIPRPLL